MTCSNGCSCARTSSLGLARRHRGPSAEAHAQEALIIQTTISDRRTYDAGLHDALRMVIDEFTLTYPGIRNVEHEYFRAVHGADEAMRQGYLERVYALGRELRDNEDHWPSFAAYARR